MSDHEGREGIPEFVSLARGPKGEQGERGTAGLHGLPSGQAKAIVYLFVLNLLLIGACFGGLVYYVHAQRAAQQRQGLLVERKICTTLGTLAALKPPPGDPATNPSRAFDQDLHATLAQLGPDLGCRN